jgi:ubiquitin-like protein Pup
MTSMHQGSARRWVMAREGGQQQRTTRKSTEDEETPEPEPDGAVAERKEKLDDDVDAILDEIDEVLESNAEEFVRGFVQKGGQ